jgi:hypothetical protein
LFGFIGRVWEMLSSTHIDPVAQWATVIGVVSTVVVGIWSFISIRRKEARTRQIEASTPFLETRQRLYVETAKVAAILANPDTHTPQELAAARKRFRELYIVELSMVESEEVEEQMVAFAKLVDPELAGLTEAQSAAYEVAHALRDTSVVSWDVRRSGAITRWWSSIVTLIEGFGEESNGENRRPTGHSDR